MKVTALIVSIFLLLTNSIEVVFANHHISDSSSSCKGLNQGPISTPITRASTGHVLIETQFNSTVQQTVVDTGGIGVGGVVSKKVLSEITSKQGKNLSKGQMVDVQGAHHRQAMQMQKLSSVGVPSAQIEKMNFVVSPNVVIPEENIETLIGSKYLCNFLVEFDLQKNQLTLYPKDYTIDSLISEDENQWSISPYKDIGNSGAITFNMSIESKPVKAVLDTGARHTIMNWKAAKKIGLSTSSPRINQEKNAGIGIHGNAPEMAYTVQLDLVAFVEQTVKAENMKIYINDMPHFKMLFGDAAAINLGIDFFNDRKLLIDYAQNQIAITR